MEDEALQKLDEQLDLLKDKDLNGLTDDDKDKLLLCVVKLASCYVAGPNAKFLMKGLDWARVALSLKSDDNRARLLEAEAIDKLDDKGVRPQRLGLAITRLRQVLKSSRATKEERTKASNLLYLRSDNDKQDYDDKDLSPYSLRARYCRQLGEFVMKSSSVKEFHRNKGETPIKIIKGVTPKSLGLKDASDDLTASRAWTLRVALPAKNNSKPGATQKLKKFVTLVAGAPEYSLDELTQRDAFRRSGVESQIRVVSWNAQLMNKLDGPTDARIEEAIVWKAENIGQVVREPGAGTPRRHHDNL